MARDSWNNFITYLRVQLVGFLGCWNIFYSQPWRVLKSLDALFFIIFFSGRLSKERVLMINLASRNFGIYFTRFSHFAGSWVLMIVSLIYVKKTGGKLNARARIAQFIRLSRRRILMNVFFNSQFNYLPLVWTCYSRTNNRKIHGPLERCLNIIHHL